MNIFDICCDKKYFFLEGSITNGLISAFGGRCIGVFPTTIVDVNRVGTGDTTCTGTCNHFMKLNYQYLAAGAVLTSLLVYVIVLVGVLSLYCFDDDAATGNIASELHRSAGYEVTGYTICNYDTVILVWG